MIETLIALIAIVPILGIAWAGMRFMQRTTGCASEMPAERAPGE